MALRRRLRHSGETGVELARNREFDYLVTGVVMPQMNGIEAAIEICKLLPGCKVVLVSGNNDSCALLQEALSRGYKIRNTSQAGASACTFPNASLSRNCTVLARAVDELVFHADVTSENPRAGLFEVGAIRALSGALWSKQEGGQSLCENLLSVGYSSPVCAERRLCRTTSLFV